MGKSRIVKIMLIALFISPELIAILFAVGLAFWCPTFVVKIGNLFMHGWQMYLVLVGFPLGGLAFGVKSLHSLLHPKNAEQKDFYKWPDYFFLRYYGYISLVLCLTGAAIAILFLIMPQLFTKLIIGTIYLAATLAWLFSIITLEMAKLRIDTLLGGGD